MKKNLMFLSAYIMILFTLYILVQNGIIWFVYPDRDKYPVRGIDVSHHQGIIDWQLVKEQDVSFVFMKATEGDDFKDRQFEANWLGAKSAGLLRGAYHYYSLRFPGRVQAENFIDSVPDDEKMLPPVVDLEYGGNSKKRPPRAKLQAELNEYILTITGHYRQRPILYVTYEFFHDYLYPEFTGYDIWIRDIFSHPSTKEIGAWVIWQYHCRGHIEGIDGFVDFNVFNGNQSDLVEK